VRPLYVVLDPIESLVPPARLVKPTHQKDHLTLTRANYILVFTKSYVARAHQGHRARAAPSDPAPGMEPGAFRR
jgi:hypothetical protein